MAIDVRLNGIIGHASAAGCVHGDDRGQPLIRHTRIAIGTFCALIALSEIGCAFGDDPGPRFKPELLDAIHRAEKIVITENSDPYDFTRAGSMPYWRARWHHAEYRRAKLTADAVRGFGVDVSAMNGSVGRDAVAACGPPLYHHRVIFIRAGRPSEELKICFICGYVRWRGVKMLADRSVTEVLARAVKSAGLEPERDWVGLAKEELGH